jgi:hypothetical protein
VVGKLEINAVHTTSSGRRWSARSIVYPRLPGSHTHTHTHTCAHTRAP